SRWAWNSSGSGKRGSASSRASGTRSKAAVRTSRASAAHLCARSRTVPPLVMQGQSEEKPRSARGARSERDVAVLAPRARLELRLQELEPAHEVRPRRARLDHVVDEAALGRP